MQLSDVYDIVKRDFGIVELLIKSNLFSNIPFVNIVSEFVRLGISGKMLRPLVLLLITHAAGYRGHQHIWFASILEMIHVATLLHDDVIDNATLRRGISTVNYRWGNKTAILYGDFVYTKVFQMLSLTENIKILHIFANTTNLLVEGEFLQLVNVCNLNMTFKDYLMIIEKKTAILFETAALVGAELGGCTLKEMNAFKMYGRMFGLVYQLVDDILDYTETTRTLGKYQKNDLFERKITFPLLLLFSRSVQNKRMVERIFQQIVRSNSYDLFQKFVIDSGIYNEANSIIKNLVVETKENLSLIRASCYKEALIRLVDIIVPTSNFFRNGRDSNPRPLA